MSSQDEVFCLCRQTYDEKQFMIECNGCKDWFHGDCINISEEEASNIDRYYCPTCEINNPIIYKKTKKNKKESPKKKNLKNQTGSFAFIEKLKQRTFKRAEDIPMMRLQGDEVNRAYFEEFGFDEPILVPSTRHLNVRLPSTNFSISDVEHCVGSGREIDVINVHKQEDSTMTMRKWTDYYNTPAEKRKRILNVISLEFSNTKLCDYVAPPDIVRDISWVSSYWPDQTDQDDCYMERPEVQRYCLMGVANSYTDFHIDFGGTSVWYHVLKGEKVFYMVRPTPDNLNLYETWASSSKQGEQFFGDVVDYCYKCTIKQGETVFIPTGWIHAVFTPVDSLVFGGNFLHNYNIALQLQIYEIEKSINSPEKFMFPNFEAVNWFASKKIYEELKDTREAGELCPQYLVDGLRALSLAMKQWITNKNMVYMPESLQCNKLFRDILKENKYLSKSPMKTQNLKMSMEMPTDIKSPQTSMKAKKRSNTKKSKHRHRRDKDKLSSSDAPADPTTGSNHHRRRHHVKKLKEEVAFDLETQEPAYYDPCEDSAQKSESRTNYHDQPPKKARRTSPINYKGKSDSSSDDNLYIDMKIKSKNKHSSSVPKLHLAVPKMEVDDPMDRFSSSSRLSFKRDNGMSFSTNVPRQSGDCSTTTGSIADILQAANCYSSAITKTEPAEPTFSTHSSPEPTTEPTVSQPPEVDTSPRSEAIEGMLSMSRAATINSQMENCYDDGDFVYPTLDISDGETADTNDDKSDWHPSGGGASASGARNSGRSPTPHHHTQAARKPRHAARESVESGLAAAASKLHSRRETSPPCLPEQFKEAASSKSNPSKVLRKTTKGHATAKQRLGKILKLKHRVMH